jgi:Protein of unknown function (DUF2778)
MIFYSQGSGKCFDSAGVLDTEGYSGHGAGLNNGHAERVHDVGPIPLGRYSIAAPLDPPDHLGPLALPLTAQPGTETYGRGGFFIHGDNSDGNKSASHGCVILEHDARKWIVDHRETELEVCA